MLPTTIFCGRFPQKIIPPAHPPVCGPLAAGAIEIMLGQGLPQTNTGAVRAAGQDPVIDALEDFGGAEPVGARLVDLCFPVVLEQ